MRKLLSHVQPGDLITADMWNDMADAVNALLKSNENINIAAVLPNGTATDPILIGVLVQITGQNFGHSANNAKVTFEHVSTGKIEIAQSKMVTGSGDTRLVFIMPDVPNLPRSGLAMIMRVSNGVAEDLRTVTVLRDIVNLEGDIFVNWNSDITPNPNPNPIETEKDALFALIVQTAVNMPAVVALQADIQNPTVALPAGYVDKIEFLEEDGKTVITKKSVEMGKAETRKIFMRIPGLPKEFGKQSFRLVARAVSGGLTGTFSQTFTVGAEVEKPDPSIIPSVTGTQLIDPAGNTDTNPANGSFDGTTIQVKPDYQLIIQYSLNLTSDSKYTLTVTPKEGTDLKDWEPGLVGTPKDIPGPVSARLVKIGVKPKDTATQDGTIVFRITKPNAEQDWTKEINVHLLPD